MRHMICLVSLVDPVPWRWTEQAFTTLAQACVAPCPSKCAGNCYHCSVQLPSTTILWTLNTFMTKSKTPRSQQHMDSMPGRHRAGSQKSHLLVKESGGPSMQGSRAEPMCHHEDVRLWCWMWSGSLTTRGPHMPQKHCWCHKADTCMALGLLIGSYIFVSQNFTIMHIMLPHRPCCRSRYITGRKGWRAGPP